MVRGWVVWYHVGVVPVKWSECGYGELDIKQLATLLKKTTENRAASLLPPAVPTDQDYSANLALCRLHDTCHTSPRPSSSSPAAAVGVVIATVLRFQNSSILQFLVLYINRKKKKKRAREKRGKGAFSNSKLRRMLVRCGIVASSIFASSLLSLGRTASHPCSWLLCRSSPSRTQQPPTRS